MKKSGFYIQLVRMLGFLPRNTSLYRLAFLPRSAASAVQGKRGINNERLEYLGDAVLDTIVAGYLFKHFPQADEGFMTKVRARIVKRKSLDKLALETRIPSLINYSILPGNQSKHLYGNALEALIGAIYLDRGYSHARRFFAKKILEKHINLDKLADKDPDHKSRIIEWSQKNKVEVVFENKEEHSSKQQGPSFVSTILLNNSRRGEGRGSSKKEAEQRAAKEALVSLTDK